MSEGDQVGVPKEGLPSSGNHEIGVRDLKTVRDQKGLRGPNGRKCENGVREMHGR